MVGWLVRLTFSQQWHMNGDVVGPAQRFLELHIFYPGLLLLNSAGMPQIHDLLNCGHELVIVISRIVTEDVHVEAGTFFYHRQTDASRADDRDRFASHFIAEEGEKRMPGGPLLLAHESLALPHSSRQCPHHE